MCVCVCVCVCVCECVCVCVCVHAQITQGLVAPGENFGFTLHRVRSHWRALS